MRKALSFVLVILMLALVVTPALAADPNDFEAAENSLLIKSADKEAFIVIFPAKGGDPKYFEGVDYPWIKVCVLNPSNADSLALTWGIVNEWGEIGVEAVTKVEIAISTNDTEFQSYIANMITESYVERDKSNDTMYWDQQTIGRIRVYPMGYNHASGEFAFLRYIAFFKTEEDANAFDGIFEDEGGTDPDFFFKFTKEDELAFIGNQGSCFLSFFVPVEIVDEPVVEPAPEPEPEPEPDPEPVEDNTPESDSDPVNDNAPAPTPPAEDNGGPNWAVIISIAAIVVIAAIIVIVVVRKKKKPADK